MMYTRTKHGITYRVALDSTDTTHYRVSSTVDPEWRATRYGHGENFRDIDEARDMLAFLGYTLV